MRPGSFPEVDRLRRALSPEERSATGLLDLQRLKVEQAGVGAEGVKEKVLGSVTDLDDRYSAMTVDDRGTEFAQYRRPLAEGRESRWWWMRKPRDLPPGW